MLTKNKNIYDPIYGYITISPLKQKIIDTPEFQRLRTINQLGVSHFVYPGASNTRFEHSIGVSYLASKLASKLTTDKRCIELISIAGLLHDIGHGPYSHIFDDTCISLNLFEHSKLNQHEHRSIEIFKALNKKYDLKITYEEETFICNCIVVPKELKNNWKYQIISSEIDVDRMDYVLRDSQNTGITITTSLHKVFHIINNAYIDKGKLVFHKCVNKDIKDFLNSRKYMYDHVYKHRVSSKISKMVFEIFRSIFKSTISLETFIGLNDSLLYNLYFGTTTYNVTRHTKKQIERIFMRKFN